MKRSNPSRTHASGFALVTVVLVLAALLLLCTPFLLTARNADQSSQQLFHRAQARIALDNASTHARALLEGSHPSRDTSLYSDSLEELRVPVDFAEGFLNARDAEGVMWDVRASDVAGKIDLGSAPPQLIAAMLGSVSRLVQPLPADETDEIPMASVEGLDPSGLLWIGGELISYGKIEGGALKDIQRGVGAQYDSDDKLLPGPLGPTLHAMGTTALDQRAMAPVEWRLFDGGVRTFDSTEQFEEVNLYASPEQPLRPDHFESMERLGSVYGGAGTGVQWQRAARMMSSAQAQISDTLRVDSPRWFGVGSTIRIQAENTVELAVVRRISRTGTIFLDRGFQFDYNAFEAEVSVLARRPVNINTASPGVLQVLMQNLKLRERNHRISGGEAKALAGLIVESRPFDGLEDFLQRLVLPAAGLEALPTNSSVVPDAFAADQQVSVIDPFDAVALYANALNANDYTLEYSTMPFCFTSNDVYDLDLRAVINDASGVERYTAGREETLAAIPQEELTHVFATQQDYDELLRNKREAPYWATGPEPTSRHDGAGSQPPTRMWAHLGTYEGQLYLPGVVGNPAGASAEDAPQPEHTFAQRESADGYCQLFHTEVDEGADPELQGHMLHFTHDTSDPEGRYLPDKPISFPSSSTRVGWDPNSTGLVRGFQFSFWLKPRAYADAHLLDVGGSSTSADRVELLFEGGDLVLRVLDGGGDHLDTGGFKEAVEVRYALTNDGISPGLPLDIWNHIEVDVRGARPSQVALMVNGLAYGTRTLGMTRLTATLSANDTSISVESIEGFPTRGVLRIGDELIEYTLNGGGFDASYIATGPDAGFGGRNARVIWSGTDPPLPLNISLNMNHPQDATVELYGYAHSLAADTTAGQGTTSGTLGMFRVGVVNSVVGTGNQYGDQINAVGLFGPIPIGVGITPLSQITALNLGVAETPDDTAADVGSVMAAFDTSGGYACLMQLNAGEDFDGNNIGGWSVIRYSGWSGTTLQIAAWGHQVPELTNLQAQPSGNAGTPPQVYNDPRSFIVRWSALTGGVPIQDIHEARLFIMPISLAVPGSGSAFLDPMLSSTPTTAGSPIGVEFAQITELGAGELTEWVAYNSIQTTGGQTLVRDDPNALQHAYRYVLASRPPAIPDDPSQPMQGPGVGPPSGLMVPAASTSPPAGSRSVLGSDWQPILGEPEDDDLYITKAVREAFQFRGVLGTFSHDHPAGTDVLPVYRSTNEGVNGGLPGRYDPVFLMAADFSHLGWPLTIYRGHRSDNQVITHSWTSGVPGTLIAQPGVAGVETTVGFGSQDWYFTFDKASPAPVAAGTVAGGGNANIRDSRALGRLLRFPSGERPREVTTVAVGSETSGAGIASAVVDEVAFGTTNFGTTTPGIDPETTQAAQLILRTDLSSSNAGVIEVFSNNIRIAGGVVGSTHEYLNDLDDDGGLVRIGNEIIAYEALDPVQGYITIAQGGRGLLGTTEGVHERGNTVTFLDGYRVAILAGGISATDGTISVTNTADFPREGTVLIGRELIHYTRLMGGSLDMPRASDEAGRHDGRGAGLFRGRFGTIPEGHAAGEPVIFFPMRYWDRWTEMADAPELAYFGLEIAQPAAFWRSFDWQEQSVGLEGVGMGVLMRTDRDVPWDADTGTTDGLTVFRQGDAAQTNWIGHQAPGVEWRVFVEYSSGAFDADTGMGHAWRTTPRLNNFIIEYLGPSMTLRSVER